MRLTTIAGIARGDLPDLEVLRNAFLLIAVTVRPALTVIASLGVVVLAPSDIGDHSRKRAYEQGNYSLVTAVSYATETGVRVAPFTTGDVVAVDPGVTDEIISH